MSQPVRPPVLRAVRKSTAAPRLLTVGGAGVLVAGMVALVLAVQSFVGLLPLGILNADGTAGPDVVATVPSAGSTEAVLAGGTDYALYLARSQDVYDRLIGAVVVLGPDGARVTVADSADVSVSTARGGVVAHTVGSFRTSTAGSYTLTAPGMLGDVDATVLVAADRPVLPLVTGVFGTITGLTAGGLMLVLGIGMVVGGILWWHSRRSARVAASAAPTPAG